MNSFLMKELNKVEKSAFKLICSDASFFITLVEAPKDLKLDYNIFNMLLPYIGLFSVGAEQWGKKVGLESPKFNLEEKKYYDRIREKIKLFKYDYSVYYNLIKKNFFESDNYFHRYENYYNAGITYYGNIPIGNTILYAMNLPYCIYGDDNIREKIKNMSIIAGKLASYYNNNLEKLKINIKEFIKNEDYHLFVNCPFKIKNMTDLTLFSIVCNINFSTDFINSLIIDETIQKFKFAYIQYYYLCDMVNSINKFENTNFKINTNLKNDALRNCMAHYGLGQIMKECDINENDVDMGVINKLLNVNFNEAKKYLYENLYMLKEQLLDFINRS